MKEIFRNFLKNEWYYWYNGFKFIALLGWSSRLFINIFLLFITLSEVFKWTGFVFGIIIVVVVSFLNDIFLILILIAGIFFPKIVNMVDWLGFYLSIFLAWFFSRFLISFVALKRIK